MRRNLCKKRRGGGPYKVDQKNFLRPPYDKKVAPTSMENTRIHGGVASVGDRSGSAVVKKGVHLLLLFSILKAFDKTPHHPVRNRL